MDIDEESDGEGNSSISVTNSHVEATTLEAVPNEDTESCAQRALERVLGQIHASPLDTDDKATAMEFAHSWREVLNRGVAEYIATFHRLIRDRSTPHGETPDPSQLSANAYVNVLNGTMRITMSAWNPSYGEDRARLWEGTVPLAITPISKEMFVCIKPDDDGGQVVSDAITNAGSWFRLSEIDRVPLDRGEFEVEVYQDDTAMGEQQQSEGPRRRDLSAYLSGQGNTALRVRHAQGAVRGARAAWERALDPGVTDITAGANIDEAAQALSLALQNLRVGFHHPSYNPEAGRFSVRVGAKHLKTQTGEIVPYPAWSIANRSTDQSIRRSGHHPLSFASYAAGAVVEIVPPLAPPIPAVPESAPMPDSPQVSPLSSLTSTPSIEPEELPSGSEPVRRIMTRSHARLMAVQDLGPSRVQSSPPFDDTDALPAAARSSPDRPADIPHRSGSSSNIAAQITVMAPEPPPPTMRTVDQRPGQRTRWLGVPSFQAVALATPGRDLNRTVTVRYKTKPMPRRSHKYHMTGEVEIERSDLSLRPAIAGTDRLYTFEERDLTELRWPRVDVSLRFDSDDSIEARNERWEALIREHRPTFTQMKGGRGYWMTHIEQHDKVTEFKRISDVATAHSIASFRRWQESKRLAGAAFEPGWVAVPRIVHHTPSLNRGSKFLLYSWAVLNGEEVIARSIDDPEHPVTRFGPIKVGYQVVSDRDVEP